MIRKVLEELEKKRFHARASFSKEGKRMAGEQSCQLRTAFQQDRDKILHSKAFRRLKHKTQVFLSPVGDHYRTRLTHTLEVMQIARTIARSLQLNEDLVEAASIGHDLGHTPFGHAGEEVLNRIHLEGFHHAQQSVRIVEKLEDDGKGGKGLNLTRQVVEAIEKHSKGKGPILSTDPRLTASTLEGQIVRISDILAYVNHDLDDAIRAGVLALSDIPKPILNIFGKTHAQRIETMILDVILETQAQDMQKIWMSPEKLEALIALRTFMFENVYETELVQGELKKAKQIIEKLYEFYTKNPDHLLSEMTLSEFTESIERHALDFISGMTDRFAIQTYQRLHIPRSWHTV